MTEREWVLLNPGPANTTETVRQALVMADLCHREPECFEMMRSVRHRLSRLSGGGDGWSTVLAGSAAAVEMAIARWSPPTGRSRRRQRCLRRPDGPDRARPQDPVHVVSATP
jgi:aspartate aminotransferase-like enzyme